MADLETGLYQSDALILFERIPSNRVTLVYLDPPWGRYRLKSIEPQQKEQTEPEDLGEDFSYLSKVIQQAWRVLCDEGNLVFHAEPMFSGIIRPLLDDTFGMMNFRAEIISVRNRSLAHSRLSGRHDTIYWYGKTSRSTWNDVYKPYDSQQIERFAKTDERGRYMSVDLTTSMPRTTLQYKWRSHNLPPGRSWRYSKEKMESLLHEGRIELSQRRGIPRLKRYLDESPGMPIDSIWDDILFPRSRGIGLAYATQKPLPLMERILSMASNSNDLVLDPFCGTGTTLAAAQAMGRRWLGCDISSTAVRISDERLREVDGYAAHIGTQEELETTYPIVSNAYRYSYTGLPLEPHGNSIRFVYGRRLPMEETKGIEFKEITSGRPVESIKNTADEYVVAFLNAGGNGRILWGIRDADGTVTGVKLTRQQRDDIRRTVADKLAKIQPPISPNAFHLKIHQVLNGPDPDLQVVEIRIPQASSTLLYFTEGNQTYVKTEGGKKELKGLQLQAEIISRLRR